MWPTLVFIGLVLLVVAHSIWRELRARRQRRLSLQEFTAQALEQQQQAYAQARAQQQALFNSMAEGVLLLDRNGKIEMTNRSLGQLFSLPSDMQGRTLAEALQIPELAEAAGRLPQEKSTIAFELELPGPLWRVLDLNASAVLDRNGNYQGAIFVFHDLTRIKQLENTRKDFVANVSHELRTPLSLIKGFVETLLEGAMDDPERATRFLQTIEKHTDRLTYLIEDLLTISMLEGGSVSMNLQQVQLRELADRVIDDLQSRAQAKHTVLQNLLSPDLTARADADRIQQVLFNLVENAIKYGGEAGRTTISGRATDNQTIEVWVQDNGPGIPHEAQERVFERFYRVDRARSREAGGTGLGLAIVKHIVLAHGGAVSVKSEPGQGASFHFTLPVA